MTSSAMDLAGRTGTRKASSIRFRLDTVLLMLGVAMIPVYVFRSGGVQPAHFILFLFSLVVIARKGVPVTLFTTMFFGLCLHSAMVELVGVVTGADLKSTIHSLFFFYNATLSVALIQFFRHEPLDYLSYPVLIAAGIALFTVLGSGVDLREMTDSGRATGSFRNPNQLGYFSVCLLSLGYLCYIAGSISYRTLAIVLLSAVILSITSLSKAAMIANFAVMFFALKPKASWQGIALWCSVLIIAIAVLLTLLQSGYFEQYLFYERIANMGAEDDSSLASRGYFAFMEGSLFQIIFGVGYSRIDAIVGHEVHSTLASVLNNYGIIGSVMFMVMLWFWVSRVYRVFGLSATLCLVGPALIYGITHNGVRFTIFWLLVSASIAAADRELKKRKAVSGETATDRYGRQGA